MNQNSIKQPFWAMKIDEVLSVLETNLSGLDEKEAGKRLAIFGSNSIAARVRLPKTRIFLNQFKGPLIIILLVAGGVTFFIKEWIDAGVIFSAVLLNAALGFYQESKAENALELLKSYIRARSRVKRAAQDKEIDGSELVPGDIIRITQGDRIPADARLIFVNSLETDESVLTGESLPVQKDPGALAAGTALGERRAMVFSGTLAVEGFADAVVTSTGKDTEFGKIAALLEQRPKEKTPLERSIGRFTVQASAVLALLTIFLFAIGVAAGYGVFEMFLIGVAVAVSAVPEGLPVALTVILAVGVEHLAKRKAVVRQLLAAETLGSTTLILTDKTGTLTQAKMEIAAVLPYRVHDKRAEDDLLGEALINTDVVIQNPQDSPEAWQIHGRALEAALVKGAARRGIKLPEQKVIDRIPFTSKDKFSAAIYHTDIHGHIVLVGAPEILLRSTRLNEEERKKALAEIDARAWAGERLIGVICKKVSREHKKIDRKKIFEGFDFLGLIAFRDPLRPGVASAMHRIASSGVKTIIVTGDHQGTAEAVARELGLIDGHGAVLTGDDLNYLSPEELENRADQVTVYARVSPEQKVQIVNLYKKRGQIVAMTGDGVNDAPALQSADIGVSVGSGTDVAKVASDLVLLDDNFETLVLAIEEGRRIVDNIRKVIAYLLSSALDELLLIGGSMVMGIGIPLNALQILFVNFFSDSFPAVGFAFERGAGAGAQRGGIFDRRIKFLIGVIGLLTSALLFLTYYGLLNAGFDPHLVRTFIFASFGTYSLMVVFSLRSFEKSILEYNPFGNLFLTAGVAFGLMLTAGAVYIPWLQLILDTKELPAVWAAGVLGVGIFNIMLVEVAKILFRKKIIS